MMAVITIGARKDICTGEVVTTGIISTGRISAKCNTIVTNTMTGTDTTEGTVSVIN